MANYPLGMTREHWKYIDGEQHYRGCPMHEDRYDMLCRRCNWPTVSSQACPECGLEPECRCEEIAQAIKDEAKAKEA